VTRGPRISWDRFQVIWKLALGTAVIGYGVIVTAESSPTSLPWVLITGAGLVGLTITVPWERRRDDDEDDS
jgi:hypothetical protein